MNHKLRPAKFASALLATCLSVWLSSNALLPQAHAATPKPGKSCHLPGQEGPLRCLYINVPRDYANPSKGNLDLHITFAPAFREKAKSDPLVVLAGGPGQSGSSIVAILDAGLNRVRATRDIIFIDQRGTGKSGKLSCDSLNRIESVDHAENEKVLHDCLSSLKPDLSQYTTRASAQDIDRVRSSLGFAQINLWGASYGTRLAQEYARMFPKNLRSMVIDGVVSPQQNVGLLSSDTGRATKLLVQHCQNDANCQRQFPQFAQQLDDIMTRAKRGNEIVHAKHPVTGKDLKFPLRHEDVSESLRSMLYVPSHAARMPWIVQQAHGGNWQPLVAASFTNTSWQQDGMAIGLTLAVLCGEDVGHIKAEDLLSETPLSFLGDSWAKKLQRWCGIIKLPARERPSTSKIETPTLLLSGAIDPVTPPTRATEAMQYLLNSQHLIAEQASHGVSQFGCTQRLIRQFIDAPNKKVDGACLKEIGKPPFVMSAAGAEP